MTTTQHIGCILFGFIIAGSMMLTQRSPDIRHMLLAIWTFSAVLCGAATEWKHEVVLLIWYVVALDLVEFTLAGISVTECPPKWQRRDRFLATDLRDACIFWYPLYCIVLFIVPEYAIVDTRPLFWLNLVVMWYMFAVFWGRSARRTGHTVTEITGAVISGYGACGMTIYAMYRIYRVAQTFDWGWVRRFINSVF